jgi:hypothetical protein
MKTVIVELPIDKFGIDHVEAVRETKFPDQIEFDKLMARMELTRWYDIETFINGINNDSIDTENNWFAPVIIYN